MSKYALFRGNKMVGRVLHTRVESAVQERDQWNKQFAEFTQATGKSIDPVEVREFKKPRKSAEQRLREMFT